MGSPLVFIHGMADSARSFILIQHHLIQSHTCIAYELPDGTTDGSELGSYTHEHYVGDLLELLDHLGFATTALLGSSFGSTIALAAMSGHPERFTPGILQGAFAYRPLSLAQRKLVGLARSWPGFFGDWPRIYSIAMKWIERPTVSVLPPEVKAFLLESGGRTPLRAAALRSIAIDRLDLRPSLPEIRTPILMVGGDRDPLVPRWCERDLETNLPHVKRIEFAECGHYPYYTHPRAMAEVVDEFLAERQSYL
jgi:pimeloyl-ACP methyl ester carboxylesterase